MLVNAKPVLGIWEVHLDQIDEVLIVDIVGLDGDNVGFVSHKDVRLDGRWRHLTIVHGGDHQFRQLVTDLKEAVGVVPANDLVGRRRPLRPEPELVKPDLANVGGVQYRRHPRSNVHHVALRKLGIHTDHGGDHVLRVLVECLHVLGLSDPALPYSVDPLAIGARKKRLLNLKNII